jgi:hypothetical protein
MKSAQVQTGLRRALRGASSLRGSRPFTGSNVSAPKMGLPLSRRFTWALVLRGRNCFAAAQAGPGRGAASAKHPLARRRTTILNALQAGIVGLPNVGKVGGPPARTGALPPAPHPTPHPQQRPSSSWRS